MSESAESESPKKKKRGSILSIVSPEEAGIIEDRPEPRVWGMLAMMGIGKGDDRTFIPMNTPLNVSVVLTHDTRWAGRIRTNDFDGTTYVQCPEDRAPRAVSGNVATEVVHWLERVYTLRTTEERVGKELNVVGDRNKYHPIRDRLRSLVWDRKPRLDDLLSGYLSAPVSGLTSALGRCWMLSAVARVMRPGCKVDTVLILVGSQGAKKSTACRILAMEDDWYSDTPFDLRSKDMYESIHGAWIYEIAEIDSFRNAEWPRVKAAVSSARDRYRRPYSPAAEKRDRQVVFVGTTNEDRIFGDATGSRRFWPVAVGRVNVKALMRDREQLWAEAVHCFDAGERWWLSDEHARELADYSEAYQHRHPWFETVSTWTNQQSSAGFTISEVLAGAIKKPIEQWTRRDEMDVGDILRELGFERHRRQEGGRRIYCFVRAAV